MIRKFTLIKKSIMLLLALPLSLNVFAQSTQSSQQRLGFTSMCSDDPSETLRWRVRNNNQNAVPFTWKVHNTDMTGNGIAEPGDNFFTTTSLGLTHPNTTIIYWGDGESKTQASGKARCTPSCGDDIKAVYEVEKASNHVLWMKDFAGNSGVSRLVFVANSGVMTLDKDGLLHLTGYVTIRPDNGKPANEVKEDGRIWKMDWEFGYIVDGKHNGKTVVPKKAGGHLPSDDDLEDITSHWDFWRLLPTSTLTEIGRNDNEIHQIKVKNQKDGVGNDPFYGFQVGEQGSLQSYGHGGSAWIKHQYFIDDEPQGDWKKGDINVKLTPKCKNVEKPSCEDEGDGIDVKRVYNIFSTRDHAFVMPNAFVDEERARLKFTDQNKGYLAEYVKDGQYYLNMTGVLEVVNGGGSKMNSLWCVNITFKRLSEEERAERGIVPKHENKPKDMTNAEMSADWTYWEMLQSTEGVYHLSEVNGGGNMELTNKNPKYALQLGTMGSLKATNREPAWLGCSLWFDFNYTDKYDEDFEVSSVGRTHGDINADLEVVCEEDKEELCDVPSENLIENGGFDDNESQIDNLAFIDIINGNNIDISMLGSFSPYINQTPYNQDITSMRPEGTVSITTDPSDTHVHFKNPNSFANLGSGNMLLVNGATTSNPTDRNKWSHISTNDHLTATGNYSSYSVAPIWVSNSIEVSYGESYNLSLLAASVVGSNAAQLKFVILSDKQYYDDLTAPANIIATIGSEDLPQGNFHAFKSINLDWSPTTSGNIRVAIYNDETALGGNDFAFDNISLTRCGGNLGEIPCGYYFITSKGLLKAKPSDDANFAYEPDFEGGYFVEGIDEIDYTPMDGYDFSYAGLSWPLISIECSPCDLYYIDNHKNLIFTVRLDGSDAILTKKFELGDATYVDGQGHTKKFNDAHIALNVSAPGTAVESGSRLYVFESSKLQYGYFDVNDHSWHYVGKLILSGGQGRGSIVQASFNPNGQLFITSTKDNLLYEVIDVYNDGTNTMNYGSIQRLNPNAGNIAYADLANQDIINGNVDIQGADIAFDQDGTFYMATHKNAKLYSVSGYQSYMIGKEVSTTKPRVTGLAVMNNGTGNLIYSAKDRKYLYEVNKFTGVEGDAYKMYYNGEEFTSGWGDMSSACLEFTASCTDFAGKAVAYEPGTMTGIANARKDKTSAEGPPQVVDQIVFASLGFDRLMQAELSAEDYNFLDGLAYNDVPSWIKDWTPTEGYIDLKLNGKIYNWNKNGLLVGQAASREAIDGGTGISKADLIIVETSYGKLNLSCGVDQDQNYPERALYYGSKGGNEWVYLGHGCRTTFVDVEDGLNAKGWDYIDHVRVVNFTDFDLRDGDGYDVDGVIYCPENVFTAITGISGQALTNARQEASSSVFNWDYVSNIPDVVDENGSEIIELENQVSIYPNPSKGIVNINVGVQGETTVNVKVYNTAGIEVFKYQSVSFLNEQVNFGDFGPGMYIAVISANNQSITKKFVVTR